MRTKNDYFAKRVKRKKIAQCKCCNKIIEIGQPAYIVQCQEYLTDMVNIIGITCMNCVSKFIDDNILETEILINKK
jgi:hypothetical protein